MIEVDLHIHSRYSYDSFQSIGRIVRTAKARGLDAFAITDHNAFVPPETVAPLLDDDDPTYVPGSEVRTEDYDDLLGLFLETGIEATTFEAAIEEIHAQGGLAVLPHPYRKYEEVPNWVVEAVDALEGLNARSKPEWNARARELGERHGLPILGGSDAHTSLEIGHARTRVRSDGPPTADQIKEAIADGRIEHVGTESPYYLFHGASVVMETIKSTTGRPRLGGP